MLNHRRQSLNTTDYRLCDFSISASISRAAKVGDKLVTRSWPAGTTGFCDVNDHECAVCLTPGTEIAFDKDVVTTYYYAETTFPKVAIFRQKDKHEPRTHHDYLEFADDKVTQMLLTRLNPGQTATVLQLPAQPKSEEEVEEQKRAEFVG